MGFSPSEKQYVINTLMELKAQFAEINKDVTEAIHAVEKRLVPLEAAAMKAEASKPVKKK
jgi:hypothetical protein